MGNNIKTTESISGIPASVSDGARRRQWHAPMLKTLKVSDTQANSIPGTLYDGTYHMDDGS